MLSLTLWQSGKLGAWILLAGAMRYLFVAAAWNWQWLSAPLPSSKPSSNHLRTSGAQPDHRPRPRYSAAIADCRRRHWARTADLVIRRRRSLAGVCQHPELPKRSFPMNSTFVTLLKMGLAVAFLAIALSFDNAWPGFGIVPQPDISIEALLIVALGIFLLMRQGTRQAARSTTRRRAAATGRAAHGDGDLALCQCHRSGTVRPAIQSVLGWPALATGTGDGGQQYVGGSACIVGSWPYWLA